MSAPTLETLPKAPALSGDFARDSAISAPYWRKLDELQRDFGGAVSGTPMNPTRREPPAEPGEILAEVDAAEEAEAAEAAEADAEPEAAEAEAEPEPEWRADADAALADE